MFKLIFRIIGIIFLLLLIGTGVLLYLVYDDEEIPYSTRPEAESLEVMIASDLEASLLQIANTNYQDNYLTIALTTDEINGIIIDLFRQKNADYLIDENNKVFEVAGTSFDGLFFDIEDDKLCAKAYFQVIGFYKSNVELKAYAEISEDKKLEISFSDLILGKDIKITKDFVNKFRVYINKLEEEITVKGVDIDFDNLSISFDFKQYISNLSDNQLINEILINGNFDLAIEDEKLLIKIDTTPLFNGGKAVLSGTEITAEDVLDSFVYESGLKGSITLTESHFNYLVQSEFVDDLQAFNQEFTFGGKTFLISFEGFYYDFKTSTIMTNLKINDCITSAALEVILTPNIISDKLASIDVIIKKITIGETTVEGVSEMIPTVNIPASTLAFNDLLDIDDIIIDNENEKVVLKASMKTN